MAGEVWLFYDVYSPPPPFFLLCFGKEMKRGRHVEHISVLFIFSFMLSYCWYTRLPLRFMLLSTMCKFMFLRLANDLSGVVNVEINKPGSMGRVSYLNLYSPVTYGKEKWQKTEFSRISEFENLKIRKYFYKVVRMDISFHVAERCILIF